jgi:hypothetical protein
VREFSEHASGTCCVSGLRAHLEFCGICCFLEKTGMLSGEVCNYFCNNLPKMVKI